MQTLNINRQQSARRATGRAIQKCRDLAQAFHCYGEQAYLRVIHCYSRLGPLFISGHRSHTHKHRLSVCLLASSCAPPRASRLRSVWALALGLIASFNYAARAATMGARARQLDSILYVHCWTTCREVHSQKLCECVTQRESSLWPNLWMEMLEWLVLP